MIDDRKIRLLTLYVFLVISAIACVWKWGISGKALTAYVFLLFLTAAAWNDLHTRHIPDSFVLGAGTAGILSVLFFSEIGLVNRGMGVLCVSLLLLLISLIRPGSFGGGDIKLMASGGMFLGWERTFFAFAAAVFMAGIYCVWMLLQGRLRLKEQIAFGPFLCAGIVIEVLIS